MADDKKKEKEKDKAEAAPPVEENPEEAAKKKKKKLILFAIIGAVLVLGGGAGAFLFLSKGKKASAEQEISKEGVEGEGHGEAKKDEHGEAKKDEHGDDKGKKDEHGDAKKEGDGKGDAKKDAHADDKGKKDEHGDAKKEGDGHGDAKKEGDDKGKKEGEKAADDKKKPGIDIDFGETYKLQTFSLNLGNALENRYIRVEISLEYRGGDEQKQELDKRLPQLRDAIIGIIQRKTREFLLSPDGKEALRKEILVRVNRYMTKKIESVYITDLLIE